MSAEGTRIWAPVAEWYRTQKPAVDWNELSFEQRYALRTAYYALRPKPEEEERDSVAEIDAARDALKGYESTSGHSQVLYDALRALLELVDGAQLPAYDQRDLAKAYREGAHNMLARIRSADPGMPFNPYEES